MDWFSPPFWSALFSIIIIDLVLAGDNAVVIGMAARNVAKEHQKKAILWGTMFAIVIRAAATFIVVWLLEIPGLLLIGGLLLFWIAYRLLTEKKQHQIESGNRLRDAIRTIIIADAVMGLDNVLAIAGAAQGHFFLVLIGLAISVPIIIWGSTLILRWIERFPIIIYIGAAVLAYTAANMMTDERLIAAWFAQPVLKWGFIALAVISILAIGWLKNGQARVKSSGAV